MLKAALRVILTFLLTMVLVARFGFPALFASEISNTYLVEQANAARQKQSLPPLRYNEKLEKAAFLKAENMLKEQYWAHYGPNKESPWQFILQTGYKYTYAGENLAKGFSSSQSVHDAWMASPTHRANILDGQFQEVGIAIVRGDLLGSDIYLVVQMFGSTAYEDSSFTESTPSVQIISPQEGDILEDGIKDVRGISQNIDEDGGVTIYLDSTYVGKAKSSPGDFEYQLGKEGIVPGDHTIMVKAQGDDSEYLSDNISVTVIDTAKSVAALDCFSVKEGALELQIGYYCSNAESFSIKIHNTYYESSSDPISVSVPNEVLPDIEDIVNIEVILSNGAVIKEETTLKELGVEESEDDKGILGSIGSLSLRSITLWGFVLAAIVFLLYLIELIRKREFMHHRQELFSFILMISILFLTFNFGFVRV